MIVKCPGLCPLFSPVNVNLYLFYLVAMQSLLFQAYNDAVITGICITSHSKKRSQFFANVQSQYIPLAPFQDVVLYTLTARTWHQKIYKQATLIYVKHSE